MAAFNEFRLIGVCYGNARKEIIATKNGKRTAFTLITKSTANKTKKVYVPMLAYGKLSDKAAAICRNGNYVAVTGEIASKEFFDRQQGVSYIRLFFLVSDISLLIKATRKAINEKEYRNLIELFDLETSEYTKGNK